MYKRKSGSKDLIDASTMVTHTQAHTRTQVRLPECCLAERFMTFNMQSYLRSGKSDTHIHTHIHLLYTETSLSENHTLT